MKKIIFCISICLLNLPAFALDYNDFPPDLQKVLDEKIADLNTSTGVFIAGKITISDGAKINGGEDVMVNLYSNCDRPLWVYEGGWFMMDSVSPGYYPGRREKLVLRAFGYEPNDLIAKMLKGEVTYVECVMQKVPDENLASVSGIVTNDYNEPYEGAIVSLMFPFANHGYRGGVGNTFPFRTMTTGQDGKFSFNGLSSTQHSLTASASGCAYHQVSITPKAGEMVNQDLKLYRNRSIVIDYVYQEDGSCNFADGNLQTGTIEWLNGSGGVDFSDGRVENNDPQSLQDIGMFQDQDKLKFRIFYGNGQGNGFYDKGTVGFDSVIEVPSGDYSTEAKPCVVGHTYVVKTYENKYAKFIVKDISGDK